MTIELGKRNLSLTNAAVNDYVAPICSPTLRARGCFGRAGEQYCSVRALCRASWRIESRRRRPPQPAAGVTEFGCWQPGRLCREEAAALAVSTGKTHRRMHTKTHSPRYFTLKNRYRPSPSSTTLSS